MKTIERIAALLKQTMGLDMASVGHALIARAVDERASTLGMTDREAYWFALQAMPEEMQALIDIVVVPETWFFRDSEAMSAVARLAYARAVNVPDKVIRILSVPCSTGEEPYSIAIALLEAGMPASRFTIDAIDICTRSLEIARQAGYGRNSFRGKDQRYRDTFFTTAAGISTVSADVRRQVRFRHGNLFAPDFLSSEVPYDFIFCRNVLIYFDRTMQQQAVHKLEQVLAPDGTIFVGPAEAGIMLRPPFGSAGIPLAFAFQRKPVHTRQHRDTIVPPKMDTPITAVAMPIRHTRTAVQAPVDVVTPTLPTAQVLMQQAIDHANQGQLDTALSMCNQYQRMVGPSAAGFYLMGLITDARNDASGALLFYRKAIYLQPDHVEALTHIAALLAAQGDTHGAQLMQQRAQRAKEQWHV